jgi:hypothetical protein
MLLTPLFISFVRGASIKLPNCGKPHRGCTHHHITSFPTLPAVCAVFGLADVDDIETMALRRRFPHTLFNANDDKETSAASSKLKQTVRDTHGARCVVCSSTQATVAHILKTREDCRKVDMKWEQNFLLLCGSHGEKNTCHHMFDTFQMSFMHATGDKDMTRWVVVGGGDWNGRVVTLPNAPRRRAMHAHLTKCEINSSLKLPADASSRHPSESSESEQIDVCNV